MKKVLFILLFGILMNINIFAGGRFVLVEYKNSRRGLHNEMTIELGSENNSDKIFYSKFRTIDRRLKDDHLVIERVMSIEKEYFDTMFNRILDLDFKEIINSNENRVIADGTTISLTVGLRSNNIKITLRSPDSRSTETDKFCLILYELFALFEMEEWLKE